MVPVVPKLQQEPQIAWSLTGVTAPEEEQMIMLQLITYNYYLLSGTTKKIETVDLLVICGTIS